MLSSALTLIALKILNPLATPLIFGRIVVAVPPHYTSQRCSTCGETVKKTLSQRTHICKCGCTLDRDHNASLNILKLGLNTVGHTEFQAWGETGSTENGAIQSQQLVS